MKWQQRVRVATGLSCWQIMLHLLVVAVLVMGWMSGALVRVGLGLCVLYGVTLLSMLFLQRHHEARWRDVGADAANGVAQCRQHEASIKRRKAFMDVNCQHV